MRLHRKLKTFLPLQLIEKRNRPKQRILLQLEELETRALLSASTPAPVQQETEHAFPMLTVSPQKATAQQTPGVSGYTPSEIQQIYGFNQLAPVKGQPINGAGETIAIVDAYYDPDIASDANTFSSQFGLPLFNNTGGPTLTVVASGGGAASSLSQDPTGGWPLETSLDVEWAHAMAPQANILLVEAPDDSNDSVFNAVKYAASQPGVVAVSMSWGVNEFSGETNYDATFIPPSSNPGVTFVAASGDYGAGAIYPAASPYVLSVGGTTLGGSTGSTGGLGSSGFGTSGFGTSGFGTSGFGSSFGSFASYGFGYSAFARTGGGLYRGTGSLSITPDTGTGSGGGTGSYPGESAWSGSGGGPAAYEGYPSYQYNQPWIAQNYGYPYNVEVTNNTTGETSYYSARMTPDVAYNADPNSGYAVYDSIASPNYGTVAGWNVVGGTSAAAPQWSAIVALSDQVRGLSGEGGALDTNQVLNTLYNTLGSSPTNTAYTSVFHDITTGSNGYAAGPGYDLSTGLGTPIVNNLVPLLAGTTIPLGQLPTIVGSGYGGDGGSSSGGSGFSSFSGSSFFGFSASYQPGGGLFAGSGSLSLPPPSLGASILNGQTAGASAINSAQGSLANSLTFSLAATLAPAIGENSFLGNVSTLVPAASSATPSGSISTAASTNGSVGQASILFGASGWDGASLSWRLSSLGLPSPQVAQLADELSASPEDAKDRAPGDPILPDTDAAGEDLLASDFLMPEQQAEGENGEGEGGGDGGDG